MSGSSSSPPKSLPKSEPLIPQKVNHKRTPRMRTGGKLPLKQLATPFGQQQAPAQEPWWNLSSESSEDTSDPEHGLQADSHPEADSEDTSDHEDGLEAETDPEDDPEDDPDNDFGHIHKRRRLRRYFSSDLADESDAEELGDQDRKSPRDEYTDERDYNIATPGGDDSNL